MRASTFGAAMVAVSLIVTIMSALASTAMAASQHRSHSSRHHTTPAPPAQIACTPGGCQPIPAGCTPVPGRTWSGLPTGYDVVVCPPR